MDLVRAGNKKGNIKTKTLLEHACNESSHYQLSSNSSDLNVRGRSHNIAKGKIPERFGVRAYEGFFMLDDEIFCQISTINSLRWR